MTDKTISEVEYFTPICPKHFVGELLGNREEMEQIATQSSMDVASYTAIAKAVQTELVAEVQLLPAAMFAHHNYPGGLHAHGTEVGHQTLLRYNRIAARSSNVNSHQEKALHLGWQAFALALGTFHDMPRIAKSFKIFGVRKRDGCLIEYRNEKNGRLYDWMLREGVKSYRTEISQFIDLTWDADKASNVAIDVLRRSGYLDQRAVRRAIMDRQSATRNAIAECVTRADLESVRLFRQMNPGIKRTNEEIGYAMVKYYISQLSPRKHAKLRKDSTKMTIYLLEQMKNGIPMIDELFDIYEKFNSPGGRQVH